MIYLYALVLLIAIGVVVWRLSSMGGRADPPRGRAEAPRGPDDDPDFLRKLNRPR